MAQLFNKQKVFKYSPVLYVYIASYGLICVVFTGCVIPMDVYTVYSRKNVSAEKAINIIPGKTAKEDIFLTFGEPDEISPDGKCLLYKWEKVKAIWFVAGAGQAVGGGFAKQYNLIITFDETGTVLRIEFRSNWVTK